MPSLRSIFFLQLALASIHQADAFSANLSPLTNSRSRLFSFRRSLLWKVASSDEGNDSNNITSESNNPLAAASLALTLSAATMFGAAQTSHAYVPSDYASETVQAVVQELKTASGNVDATFKAYEEIAGIITEGKGVGGMVNYSE